MKRFIICIIYQIALDCSDHEGRNGQGQVTNSYGVIVGKLGRPRRG